MLQCTRLHPKNTNIKIPQHNTPPSNTQTRISNKQNISSSNTAFSSNTTSSQTTVTPLSNNTNTEIAYIPIENWIPLPSNYNLPEKYLPYVPQKPLFSNSGKSYHAPGSYQWLQHIYKTAKKKKKKQREKINREKEFEDQCKWKAEIAHKHGTSASRFLKIMVCRIKFR
jgi:hypothetical protein